MVMHDQGTTHLYRAYDSSGQLLYVGIATNWARRWAQHAERSAWFTDVARLDIEAHPSRAEAIAAERVACRAENPKHNIEHTPRDTRPMRQNGRGSRVERPFVRSFDHTTVARIAEYRQLAAAIDAAANRLGTTDLTQRDFETLLVDLARTVAYGDSCHRCVDHHDDPYTPWPPIHAERRNDGIRCSYLCDRGHVWRCWWHVDAPVHAP